MDENSDRGVLVGSLSVLDQDSGQSHAFTLLDSAGDRFVIDKNNLKVNINYLQRIELSMSLEINNTVSFYRWLNQTAVSASSTVGQNVC